jgi:hypothetical protein
MKTDTLNKFALLISTPAYHTEQFSGEIQQTAKKYLTSKTKSSE